MVAILPKVAHNSVIEKITAVFRMIQMPEVLARIYLCPVKSFGELILHAM